MLHRQNTTTTEESVEHTDVDNHDINNRICGFNVVFCKSSSQQLQFG